MKLDQDEARRGAYWFVFAGFFAICVAVGIYNLDLYLEGSNYEKESTNTLREVRTAAGALGSGNSDVRLRAEFQNLD